MGFLSTLKSRWADAKKEQYRRAHPLREDHYAFAHFRLRQFAQQAPDLVYNALGSKDAHKFLNDAWRVMPPGETFTPTNPELSPDSINIHRADVGPYPTFILELPKADSPGEAELIAIVFRTLGIKTKNSATKSYTPKTFYFTAEVSDGSSSEIGTPTLGQWIAEDHKLLGPLPSYSREDFLTALTQQVRQQELESKSGAFFDQKL